MLNQDSKIYVAGHRGMIGTELMKALREKGYNNLVYKSHNELDLTRQTDVEALFEAERPEYVIMNAGVMSNAVNISTNPAGIIMQNTAIISNVFGAALKYGVKKLLFVASAGCYPSDADVEIRPDGQRVIKETALRPGRIDRESERYYVMPKLLGTVMCETLQAAGLLKSAVALPTHVYGDAYYYNDPQRMPVYPALVKRFCDAARDNAPEVVVWGTGNLRREFTNVRDVVEAYILLLEKEDAQGPYNIASGRMVSIRELAEQLKAETGYRGKIVFDSTKPEANEYALMNADRLRALGWEPKVAFEDGVKMSCDYYRKNYG